MHANGNVTVSGSSFAITTGDDGVHADDAVTISGGTIVAAGYSGMAQNFGSDSTEGSTYTVTMGGQSTDVTLERLIYGGGSKGTPPDGNNGSNMGTPPGGGKGGRPGQ
mgnify:CR=1 FL=1